MPEMSEFKTYDPEDDRISDFGAEYLSDGRRIIGFGGGGYLKDAIQPLVRKFPNNLGIKRELKLSVTKFWGVGEHYHVSIEEESNPVLCEVDGKLKWQLAWDDLDLHGLRDSEAFMTKEAVEQWVREATKDFSEETHRFVWSALSPIDNEWFYKDGD